MRIIAKNIDSFIGKKFLLKIKDRNNFVMFEYVVNNIIKFNNFPGDTICCLRQKTNTIVYFSASTFYKNIEKKIIVFI